MKFDISLKEVAEFQKGFAFKSKDYQLEGIKIVKVSNLTDESIDLSQCVCIDENKAKLYDKYKLNENDVIITTVGSWPTNPASVVGKVVRVPKCANNTLLNQNAVRVKSNGIIDQKYLYYLLKDYKFKSYIIGTAQGSASQASITQEDIKKFKFNLPKIEIQRKISELLSVMDEKIELNDEMNKLLEEMSQALFKRWFIDFEFPNEDGKPYKSSGGEMVESGMGMIPKGWKVGVLADLVNVKYGKDHKKLEEGSIPVFGSGGIIRYVNRSLYEKESVLIPRKGTLNNVIYVNQPFWSVDTMFFTEMKLPNIAKFVYQFVKSKDLAMMNIGSAVPSMTTSILNSMEIVIPDEKNLEKYDGIVTSFYTKLEFNKSNSSNLISLRNLLLPKLMSGEIRVNDIEANL